MNYEARQHMRSSILDEVFKKSNPIEERARDNWQARNYMPGKKEILDNCYELCQIAKTTATSAFVDQENLYARFCKECEEITQRFQNLDAKTPTEALCSVAQVGYYLYDEVFALTSEALGLYVPNEDEEY